MIDVPAYGDLGLDDVETLEESFQLTCVGDHKLAGYPAWAQSPIRPKCRVCRKPMRYLAQITTDGTKRIAVGGDGIGWVFVCPFDHDATFTWQR